MLQRTRIVRYRRALPLVALMAATPASGQDMSWLDMIRTGDRGAVQILLDSGENPNSRIDLHGGSITPLEIAVVGHRENLALLLLERGASPERSMAVDVLETAAQRGLTRVVDVVLRQDLLRSRDQTLGSLGRSLILGANFGHFDVVDLALSLAREFTMPVPRRDLEEAHHVAVAMGFNDIARLLLVELEVAPSGALKGAAYTGSPGLVRELLDRGADPYARYPVGGGGSPRLPIEVAVERYSAARSPLDQDVAQLIVNELLDHYHYDDWLMQQAAAIAWDGREYLNQLASESTERALVAAARLGYYEVVRSLFTELDARGFTKEARSQLLDEAVKTALVARHDDIARWLVDQGAPTDSGLLHYAARRSSAGMVRHLLSLGADPLAQFEGLTPEAYWLERVEVENTFAARYVLFELVVAGAEVCWLKEHEAVLGQHMSVLEDRAAHCWTE